MSDEKILGRYNDPTALEEFLNQNYVEPDVDHEKYIEGRFKVYKGKLIEFLKEKGAEDLTLEDFVEIEKMYLTSRKDFERIEGKMAEAGTNSYFDTDKRRSSKRRREKIKRLADDEDAFDTGLALSIFGVVATLVQVVYHFKKKYVHIPLWKRGREGKQKSYKFSPKIYSEFMKYMNKKRCTADFGLLFGHSGENYVNIRAVIPLDEFIEGANTLLSYPESDLLRKLLEDIRTDINANKNNERCARQLQRLTALIFDAMETRGLFKKVPIRGLGKSYFGKNTPKRCFLGAYYYNPGLLSNGLEIDKVVEKFNEEGEQKIQGFLDKFNIFWEKVQKGLGIKTPSETPKFLFFEKEGQFEKIDNIMKGLIPYFLRKKDVKRFRDLPILVCMDDAESTKRWMCIAYKERVKIYKRLRYLG